MVLSNRNLPSGLYGFDVEKKKQLLSLAMECSGGWDVAGGIPKLCKSVGIVIQTFYNHLKQDEEFARNQWNESEADAGSRDSDGHESTREEAGELHGQSGRY